MSEDFEKRLRNEISAEEYVRRAKERVKCSNPYCRDGWVCFDPDPAHGAPRAPCQVCKLEKRRADDLSFRAFWLDFKRGVRMALRALREGER